MNKNWLLINPPTGNYIRDTRCQASIDDNFAISARAPVDLAYIAGAIEDNGDYCTIIDYPAENRTYEQLLEDLTMLTVDYLLINTTVYTYEHDLLICEKCKQINGNIQIIAKGAIFFSDPSQIFNKYEHLDIAITYDEEKAIKELIQSKYCLTNVDNLIYRKEGKVIINRQYVSNSLKLPVPKMNKIKHALYRRPDTNEMQATIVVGRGCAGKCIYCIAPIVGGTVPRYRDVDSVITEIKEYYYKYGIHNFYFSADTFTWKKDWVFEFCKNLMKLNFKISWLCTARADTISDAMISIMQQSGCWGISMGIESGSELIQTKINKRLCIDNVFNSLDICRKYRIVTLLHFIIGFPWETEEMIMQTIKYAQKCKGNIIEFYVATPIPGTCLYDIIKQDHSLTLPESMDGLNQKTAITATHYVSREHLAYLQRRAIRTIYFNPMFYLRSIPYIRTFGQLIGCIKFVTYKLKKIIFFRNRKKRRMKK